MKTPHKLNGYLEPARLPAVLLADMVRLGWVPGVPRRCQRPHCGGHMVWTPPDGTVHGDITCWFCGIPTHRVLDKAPAPRVSFDEEKRSKRGRPPKGVAPRAMCADCGKRQIYRTSPRCRRCTPKLGHYAVYAHHAPALLDVLGRSAGPMRATEIARAIGMAAHNVRHLVRIARKRGADIEIVGKRWRIRREAA